MAPVRALILPGPLFREELPALLPVLLMGAKAAHTHGAIRRDLAARGELIGKNDLWTVAHAKSRALALVTNNGSEFQWVEGLSHAPAKVSPALQSPALPARALLRRTTSEEGATEHSR